jgi:hypothetical protein
MRLQGDVAALSNAKDASDRVRSRGLGGEVGRARGCG